MKKEWSVPNFITQSLVTERPKHMALPPCKDGLTYQHPYLPPFLD